MPLSLTEMQRLICLSQTEGTERLFYAIMLLHADGGGNVYGRITELAAVANTTDELARRVVRKLRAAGHVVLTFRGRKGHMSIWHLSAIPDTTPHRAA